jgi:hypothetical protein
LSSPWQSHDPAWLVADCQAAYAQHPWLKAALQAGVKAQVHSPQYTYFESHSQPNQPGSNWQFQTTIQIDDTREGHIALDIIKHNRVGGVEYLSRVFD